MDHLISVSGLLTTCVGLVILFMDSKMPNIIQKFFLIEDKDVKEDAYETQQKNSVSSNATLYKKVLTNREGKPSRGSLSALLTLPFHIPDGPCQCCYTEILITYFDKGVI